MRTFKSSAILIAVLAALALIGWHPLQVIPANGEGQNAIVLLTFKTQPDKATYAVTELVGLLEKVKEEPHFVSIKLHVDPKDPTNILLYEEWADLTYYTTDHMNTPHLKEFMEKSRNFLSGPPEITFWEVQHIVD